MRALHVLVILAVSLLLGGSGPAATAGFLLLSGDPPALQGEVHGSVPVEIVQGRRAARFDQGGWVTLPTAKFFDPDQGGLEVVLGPNWSPTEPQRHTIFHIGENDARSHFTLFKTEDAVLRFVVKHDPSAYAALDVPIAAWKPHQWHRVRASWQAVRGALLLLVQIDDEPVKLFFGGKPLDEVPERAYIGRRGPAQQFADAAIAQFRLLREPLLQPPLPTGKPSAVQVSVDVAQRGEPFHRLWDCTTVWNNRKNPLPFVVGDPKWRRFKEAQFSLVRLVAFSESWLWGTRVERDEQGHLRLDFTDFDRLIDTCRAAGAEPYIRLAYHMPRALSSRPDARDWAYAPPRDMGEWEQFIRAIVRHLNIERKLGVKYFVCTLNEADLAVRKHGIKWQDILTLHEHTVRAAKAVDPSIKVGGPAICLPLDGLGGQCLREFVSFCRQRRLPLDFICFHRYHAALPRDYEQHVRQIKAIVYEPNPDLKPEWFCDEFNLWARDHRADDEYGASYLAAAIHYFRRAGLDKLSLVSFNDVLPPPTGPRVLLQFHGPFTREQGHGARFLSSDLTAAGVTLPGLLAHSPGRPADYTFGRFKVKVPQEGQPRLVFSTGLAAQYKGMDGVGFSVAVAPVGLDPLQGKVIFRYDQTSQAWQKHEVSLADYAGREVVIELRVDRGKGGQGNTVADHGAWGQPRLVVGEPGHEKVVYDFAQHLAEAITGTASRGFKFVYDEETIRRSTGLPLIKGPVVTAPYFVLLMYNKLVANSVAPARGPAAELPVVLRSAQMSSADGCLDDDSLGALAATDGRAVRVLVWSFNPFAEEGRSVLLRFNHLPEPLAGKREVHLRRWLIDPTHTNPWYDYHEGGKKPGANYNLLTGKLALVEDTRVPLRDGAVTVTVADLAPLATTLVEVSP